MVFKIKLVCFKAAIFMSIFAAGALSGCSSKQIANNKLVMSVASLIPGCPILDFAYTDKIASSFCIAADNYVSFALTAQLAGMCTLIGKNLTNVATTSVSAAYPIYVDCSSGALSSTNDFSVHTLYSQGFLPTIAVGDEISYTITCYVYGEKRAKETFKYFATVASSNC